MNEKYNEFDCFDSSDEYGFPEENLMDIFDSLEESESPRSESGFLAATARFALEKVETELLEYNDAPALLALAIKLSDDACLYEKKSFYIEKLSEIDMHLWNASAFSVIGKHLILKDPIGNEPRIRELIETYRKVFPYDEDATLLEVTLESELGENEKAYRVLKEAVEASPNLAQCAQKLALLELERGEYSSAIKAAQYAFAGSASLEAVVDVGLLILVETLARDHLLCLRYYEQDMLSEEECAGYLKIYEKLLLERKGTLQIYEDTIRNRIRILKHILCI